jgi:prepilin-type N-terminal cleavage/methylation domain-containing protein
MKGSHLRCHWLRQCSQWRSKNALAEPAAPNATAGGFTLLEIILSLAILAGSLAALGEVMRLADQNAALSRDETDAQIIATSIMDELLAGYRALTPVDQMVLNPDVDPPWLYSIAVDQTQYADLISLRVLVEQQLQPELAPARFELVRWMMNPEYVPPETQNNSQSSSTTSSSGGSSGSSGSSTSLGGAGGSP